MYQSAKDGISIFTFWKDIDYPEDLEIRDYEIHVFHEGKCFIYPSEVFNCVDKIPLYKSTDKIDLWYHGDNYTAWLIEYEQSQGYAQDAENYIRGNGNFNLGFNIITYKKLEDYLHIRKMQSDGLISFKNCRIVRETELWSFCFDALQEAVIQIEGRDSYCLFNTGGNIIEIIETGGLSHNVREEDLGHIQVINIKKNDMYTLLVRGATNLFKTINKAFDSILLPTFPFTISVYVWEDNQIRDCITVAENNTRPFKASATIYCDNSLIEIRIDNYKSLLSLEYYFDYIPNVINFTVEDDLKELSFSITDVEKHIEKKIPFPKFIKAI